MTGITGWITNDLLLEWQSKFTVKGFWNTSNDYRFWNTSNDYRGLRGEVIMIFF